DVRVGREFPGHVQCPLCIGIDRDEPHGTRLSSFRLFNGEADTRKRVAKLFVMEDLRPLAVRMSSDHSGEADSACHNQLENLARAHRNTASPQTWRRTRQKPIVGNSERDARLSTYAWRAGTFPLRKSCRETAATTARARPFRRNPSRTWTIPMMPTRSVTMCVRAQ